LRLPLTALAVAQDKRLFGVGFIIRNERWVRPPGVAAAKVGKPQVLIQLNRAIIR